jgi:type VI protein secretion system component VasF
VDAETRYLFRQPPAELSADVARLWIELRDMPDETELGLPQRREAARQRAQRRRDTCSCAVALVLAAMTFAVLGWTKHTLSPHVQAPTVGIVQPATARR